MEQKSPSISVIVLTYNEAKHIARAIESVRPFARDVFVVDCFSTDETCRIATSAGAKVLQNAWVTYATQYNWALANCPIQTDWVMRLDADEYVTPELAQEIASRLGELGPDVTGVRVRRRMHFMGRWIRYGGMGERTMLRIWRHGRGRCEQRWMDEHVVLDGGTTIDFRRALVDDNLNSVSWWIGKHNSYASREAVDYLLTLHAQGHAHGGEKPSGQAGRIRWAKTRIYYRLPLIWRAFWFFLFRYLCLGGFLDGKSGLVFHFMQGCWYRALVDAKVLEVLDYRRRHNCGLDAAIRDCLAIDANRLKT